MVDIDRCRSGDFAHYGAPVITQGNTVFVSFRTAADLFQVNAFDGATGTQKYTLSTDYRLPNHDWIPMYNPCITTGAFGTRVYYPGRAAPSITSTILIRFRTEPPSSRFSTPRSLVTRGTQPRITPPSISILLLPRTAREMSISVFAFKAPLRLRSVQPRAVLLAIDPKGVGTYVLTGAAANDTTINRTSHNSALALSNDEGTVYVVAKNNNSGEGYLLALNSTTLATQHRIFATDLATAKAQPSPMTAPPPQPSLPMATFISGS